MRAAFHNVCKKENDNHGKKDKKVWSVRRCFSIRLHLWELFNCDNVQLCDQICVERQIHCKAVGQVPRWTSCLKVMILISSSIPSSIWMDTFSDGNPVLRITNSLWRMKHRRWWCGTFWLSNILHLAVFLMFKWWFTLQDEKITQPCRLPYLAYRHVKWLITLAHTDKVIPVGNAVGVYEEVLQDRL